MKIKRNMEDKNMGNNEMAEDKLYDITRSGLKGGEGYWDENMNLATLCLNLWEDVKLENEIKKRKIIKCMPDDAAFENDVLISKYSYLALSVLLKSFIILFGKNNKEIMISTTIKGITIAGLNISNKDIDGLCSVKADKYYIVRNELGIAIAYLKQSEINIKIINDVIDNVMLIQFK